MRRLSCQLKRERVLWRRAAHQHVRAIASMLKKTKAIFMHGILAATSLLLNKMPGRAGQKQ